MAVTKQAKASKNKAEAAAESL